MMKRVPSFWWDFRDPNLVVVESDDDRFPMVATFAHPEENASTQIEMAERLIADLKAGREDPRRLSKELKGETE